MLLKMQRFLSVVIFATLFCSVLIVTKLKHGESHEDGVTTKTRNDVDDDVDDDKNIYQDLVYILANISSSPPPVPVSPSCSPPALPSQPDCSNQPGLTGEILDTPRRLGLMILFGFEVDTLEIALREQHQVVDKIFLVESTKTHKGVKSYF